MMPPVIAVSCCLAILTGFFSVRLIPAGEAAMRQMMFQLAREKIEKGLKEKTFTEALGDLVVFVDEIDEDGKWTGVYVSDMRDRVQPLITMAKAGYMDADAKRMLVTIVLNEGTLHNAELADNQVVDFKRYQLQIPLNPPTRVGNESAATLSRGSMTQQQLLETARQHGLDSKPAMVYLTEYHQRYALAMGCLVLSLLGMPLGMQARPGRRAIGIPLGLFFFILYHFSFTYFKILAENLVLPVVFAIYLPNILFFIMTFYIFFRVNAEKPILPEILQDYLGTIYDALAGRFTRLLSRLAHLVIPRWRSRKKTSHSPVRPSMLIHGNAQTRIFHFPACEQYFCEDCTLQFKDAEVAIKAGFQPCQYCKTLLGKN
jgi:lipopolysaccharide export system permease protein